MLKEPTAGSSYSFEGAAAGTFQCVAFTIGDHHYCIDIMSVREIRNWTGVTELPNTPGYMRGVINLRGIIVPIIDLRARFGQGLIEPTPSHVVVVVAIGDRLHGLLVDSVSDILTVKREDIAAIPETAGQSQSPLLDGLITQGEQMLAIVALDRLLAISAEAVDQAMRAVEQALLPGGLQNTFTAAGRPAAAHVNA
jgi:purine-binding chemotaxis protein CheW